MPEDAGAPASRLLQPSEGAAVPEAGAKPYGGITAESNEHLFYRLKASGEYVVPAGLFDDQSALSFTSQIFIDHKPGYYTFVDETRHLTEAQVFELYGAS